VLRRAAHETGYGHGKTSDGTPSYIATTSSEWVLANDGRNRYFVELVGAGDPAYGGPSEWVCQWADCRFLWLRREEAVGKRWFDFKPGTRMAMMFCILYEPMSTNGSIMGN
jgi:hypothetical protein